jgi:hypothetical protein
MYVQRGFPFRVSGHVYGQITCAALLKLEHDLSPNKLNASLSGEILDDTMIMSMERDYVYELRGTNRPIACSLGDV